MNPYVGLEAYINWENCGIQKGKLITEANFEKHFKGELREQVEKTRFVHTDVDGKENVYYFEQKDTARTMVVRHLGEEIKPQELFSPRVITSEVLHELDEKIIKKMFMLPNIGDVNEIEDEEITGDIFNDDSED